jgi:TRAP-type C4-dicarboxylate transport system permease small subunit
MENAAASLRKFLQSVTRYMDVVGVVVLSLMVLMLVYSVIMRKFFSPMNGAGELSEYGLVLTVFFCMAGNYLHHDAMCMDTYVEKLPRKGRWGTEVFVQVVNVVMLVIMVWRLFAQAHTVQSMGQHSTILGIASSPFVYIAAVCSVVLTVVYVVYLMEALAKTIKAWRA